MTTAILDRLVSSGAYFDRLAGVSGSPFITAITGAQDGQPLTVSGTGLDASGNQLFEGVPDDDSETPLEIAIDTEGTTEIVSEALDASIFWLTRATSFFVRNAAGVASNVVSVTLAPAATQRVFAVTQAFLGEASSRIESDPLLAFGDEIRIRGVTGAALGDPAFRGQADFDVDDSVTVFEAAVFDGDVLGPWAVQTILDLVTTATVPDVEDLTQAAAQALVQAAGLVVFLAPSVPHATVAVGSVIAQFPSAGTQLPLGGTVELTISLGALVTLVPNFYGLHQAEALVSRTAVGLTGTVHRVIDGNNTGTVINQSIAPGTVVAIGSALDLAISSNLMPDVVGELIQTAQAVVAAAGLDLDENFAEQHSSSFGVGEVIHQSPAADSVVSPGSDVSLTISLGAESVDSGGGFDFGFGFGFFRGAGASGEFLLTEAGDILVTEAGDRLLLEEALDDVPEAFVFTDQVDVARSSTITSSAITVTGINTLAAISVSGGTYDINSSGSFTSSPGTVSNGDTVRARVASSGSFSTAVSATVTIGGVSDTFTATTLASSGLSAPGVTGEIVADGSISIAYDGSHGFGAQGPTTILYDDGRNYGTVGTTIVSGNPLIGTYDSQDIEGLVSASGRNQTNGKGLLATYITSAERNTSGGARQNAVLLGGNKTEFYYSRALRWVQKGTYSGSFLKMAWLFDGTTAGAGGVWDIVLPTFYNGQNGVGYLGNNNGGQWTFGSIDNNSSAPDFVWNTYVDDTGGWNIFECWLKLGATSASDKMQFRLTSSKGVYDSGIITKAVSTSGTRRFGCLTAPFGWHGDTGGDTRVQNNDEVVASEQYMTAGAGSAARVMIGNASTLAACTDLTPWTIDLWSNTGIDCTVRDGPFADLDGKYIYVFDENSALVLNGSDESRLIS